MNERLWWRHAGASLVIERSVHGKRRLRMHLPLVATLESRAQLCAVGSCTPDRRFAAVGASPTPSAHAYDVSAGSVRLLVQLVV